MEFNNRKNRQSLDGFLNPSCATNPLSPICDKGDKLMLNKSYKEAVVEYLSAIMQSDDDVRDVRPYLGASKAYKKLKEYEKAIKKLDCARKLSSFNSEIYYELGVNHLLNEDSNRARKNFINTIRLDNKNINAQIQLALSHELLNEPQMALSIYQKIIEEHPRLILPYSHKAALYISLDMYEDAIKTFFEVLKVNPNYYRANLGVGICFDKLGKYSNAVRFYKKYIVRKPKGPTTHALIGRICEMYAKGLLAQSSPNLRVVSRP